MKIYRISIFLFTIIALSCSNKNDSARTKDWSAKVDSLIISENVNNHFDGTILIGSKDEGLYQNALGKANRTWDINMSNDTRFD